MTAQLLPIKLLSQVVCAAFTSVSTQEGGAEEKEHLDSTGHLSQWRNMTTQRIMKEHNKTTQHDTTATHEATQHNMTQQPPMTQHNTMKHTVCSIFMNMNTGDETKNMS